MPASPTCSVTRDENHCPVDRDPRTASVADLRRLDRRHLAQGEIDTEEYERRLAVIQRSRETEPT